MTGGRWDRSAEGAPLGPGSLLWGIASDPRCLLTGSAAGIMQLMLPGLGAGVTDHSNFFEDPLDRIWRSIPLIWGTIFAEDDEAGEAMGHRIRDFHPDIKGVDDHGRRYHALDPDVYWWAHATFTWEMFRARALYWSAPLQPGEREQLYAETVTWYRRYGVSDRPVPPTLTDFERRFDEVCRHDLELTPAVTWVLDPDANPASTADPVSLPGPLRVFDGAATRASSTLLRRFVYGAMPDLVRRRFEFAWSNGDRAAFAAVCAAVRAAQPAVRRGALDGLWPEGTPHLAAGSADTVVVAGPSTAQRRQSAA